MRVRSFSHGGITVSNFNRAVRFYQRLGFAPIGTQGVHIGMEWSPPRRAADPMGSAVAAVMIASSL